MSRKASSDQNKANSLSRLLTDAGSGASSRSRVFSLKEVTGEHASFAQTEGQPPRGIDFGSIPRRASVPDPPSSWKNVLAATGTFDRLLSGGGGMLEAAGGIGNLVSGIANLFGGVKTRPPLQAFELPPPQAQSFTITNRRNASGAVSNEQAVEAVKQALLTSSSLNDVIAEI